MTNPVEVHLKDFQVFKQVVNLQVGAEGGPLGVEGNSLAVGDVASMHGCLCIMEITE